MVPQAALIVGSGGSSNLSCEIVTATIHHGRSDPDVQPEASSVTGEFRVSAYDEDRLANLVFGADCAVWVWVWDPMPFQRMRFRGTLTDIRLGWESPDMIAGQFVAVSDLAIMGRRIIGDEPWPQETDGARAWRAINLAGVRTVQAQSDPGTVQVLARDVDAQPALDVAGDAALAGAGYLWNDRSGSVLYADAEHRRNAPVAVELDACELPLSVEWDQNMDGLVNDARVRWGIAPDGGDQPEVHVSNQASIDALGLFGASLSTTLATVQDAQARAGYIVARQAQPVWGFVGETFQLDTRLLDAPTITALLDLEVGSLIRVTGLPAGSPYTSALLWVEGWVETITGSSWELALATSDYCRSAGTVRWDETDPAVTWDNIGTQAWDTATCLPPRPSTGRWNDVPASLRWDLASGTWDTWAG